MLLTITTTYQPATDLGFLLHKNPSRFQSFNLPFGRADVFYPVDGIYYLVPSDYVYGLDAATGEELWSYEEYKLSTAPVVADGVLYGASYAEYLFALDALTGEELWTTPTEDFLLYSLSAVDGVLYGQIYEGFLVAVDAEDGSVLSWDFESSVFEEDHYYSVSDGVVYSACLSNSVCAYVAPTTIVKMQGTGPASTATPTPAPSPSPGDAETAIRALPWVEDGMTVDEQEAVIQLLYIASERPLIAWELTHKSWMQSDLSASENQAMSTLMKYRRDRSSGCHSSNR